MFGLFKKKKKPSGPRVLSADMYSIRLVDRAKELEWTKDHTAKGVRIYDRYLPSGSDPLFTAPQYEIDGDDVVIFSDNEKMVRALAARAEQKGSGLHYCFDWIWLLDGKHETEGSSMALTAKKDELSVVN